MKDNIHDQHGHQGMVQDLLHGQYLHGINLRDHLQPAHEIGQHIGKGIVALEADRIAGGNRHNRAGGAGADDQGHQEEGSVADDNQAAPADPLPDRIPELPDREPCCSHHDQGCHDDIPHERQLRELGRNEADLQHA